MASLSDDVKTVPGALSAMFRRLTAMEQDQVVTRTRRGEDPAKVIKEVKDESDRRRRSQQ